MDSSRQIENLLYRYAELIDGGDFPAIGQLFAQGKILDADDNLLAEGAAAVQALYEASTRLYPETGTPLTKHVTTNAIIEVDEADGVASARTYYTVLQQTPTLSLQPIITGRYHDTFGLDGQGWHFTQRKIFVDQPGDLSQHLLISLEDLDQS